jgi:hypothetical protein
MSISKENSKKSVKDWNWLQIDRYLWELISKWNGKPTTKKKILEVVMKKFSWTEKQTKIACAMHFKVYNSRKTK